MTIKALYPTINPTLNLDFANTKTLGPLVTFTRASSATYIDSAGTLQTAATDVPRFDHNPTTGESLGLLVEEARTNLLVRSEEFDNASWTVNPGSKTVTANTTVAPNGTLTADTVTADGISAAHFVDQTATLTAISYVYTVYAKAGTNNFIQLRASATLGSRYANFDVSTGATGTSANITSSSIEFVGNGWYRCSMVFTSTAATGTLAIILVTSNSAASAEVNSLSTSVNLWGAQLEAGAFPTSYIPTTSATVTRSADVASITGENFSSWYRQDEGTVFAQFRPLSTATIGIAGFDDGTNNNRWRLGRASSGEAQQIVQVLAVNQATSIVGSLALNGLASIAATVRLNDCSITANGLMPINDTSCTIPTVNKMIIGSAQAVTAAGSTIRRLTYWPQRLPNSALQAITQ
jgi:hypothetical protein